MTDLTPTQQIHVSQAERFLGDDVDLTEPSYSLGAALEHIRRLLDVIGDLTSGGLTPEPPAEWEAEECGHSDDPAYTCDALSGHGGNHTAHGPDDVVLHVW